MVVICQVYTTLFFKYSIIESNHLAGTEKHTAK